MLGKLFGYDIFYIQMFTNDIIIKNINSINTKQIQRLPGSASTRLLIADFVKTHQQLKEALNEMKIYYGKPMLLLHPMELIDGGITPVELRIFDELLHSLRGRKTGVYVGDPLQDHEIISEIKRQEHNQISL